MTTSRATDLRATDLRTTDLRTRDRRGVLLDAVGHAIGEVVRALLDDDRAAARRVLRDGARRQGLVLRAESEARLLVVGSVRRRQAVEDLLFLGDVARVSRLVDDLARLVLTGAAAPRCSPSRRESLLLLARFGEERLHQLADGVPAPGPGAEFQRCGRCLREVADALGAVTALDRGAARSCLTCCSELATAVLQASRHALRAAV